MKKNIIIILIAIIAIGVFWALKSQDKKVENKGNKTDQTVQTKEPEEVVREFYKKFSDINLYSSDIISTEEILGRENIKKYLDNTFLDYYTKYRKEYCKGIISCVSVISCVQDYPKEFSIGNVEKNDVITRVEVFNKFGIESDKKPIIFELALRTDGWKITKTICPSLK